MDMFRGCINSILEQLIKNYNVMYLLKKMHLSKKILYPWTVAQYFQQKRDKKGKKKGRRTEKNNKVNVPILYHSVFFFFTSSSF